MNLATLLTYDLTNKVLLDGTTAWTPPAMTFGESLTLALQFTEDANGTPVAAAPTVNALQAAVGYVDALAQGGVFALQIGSGASTEANTTAVLPWNVGPVSFQLAINALTAVTGVYGQAAVIQVNGSWLVKFPSYGGQPPLKVVNNTLFPVSFGRVNAWQVNGAWVQEVRLVQAPLAFTSDSAAVLPPAPSVARIQAGGSGGGTTWDEVQQLTVPAEFAGTYYLKLGDARTIALDVTDGATQIAAALQPLAPAGGVFNVTNPTAYQANIDFGGTMSGTGYALLLVVVESAPPGNLTFTLDLGMGVMWAALRASGQDSITAPLVITLWVEDDHGDVSQVTIYVPSFTVQKSVLFPELAEVPEIDWLNPPSPLNYIPFDPSQVITGQQFYQAVIGDGASTSFAIAHGLDTEVVFVFVRQNVGGGSQLVDGTDFSVVINNANEVTVTALTGAPALNAWAAYVMSAQTVAAFASGLTVTIEQVIGLEAELDSIGTQLATITALLPTAPPSISANPSGPLVSITIPAFSEMLPGRVPAANAAVSPTGALPRRGALFPCINTIVGDIAAGTFPLPAASANVGVVVQNQTGVGQLIDGGFGFDSWALPPEGYVASDGRQWYIVNQAGVTNSFFPAAMERVLFCLDVNSSMFPAGSTFELSASVTLQMLQANSRCQYMLVVEVGAMPADTSPATTATNLQNVVWNTVEPVLAQQVIMSGVGVTHAFGVSVARDATGTVYTAQRLLYGIWTGGAPAPASGNFAVRARLIQFDTEDAVADAKGTVFVGFAGGTAAINN